MLKTAAIKCITLPSFRIKVALLNLQSKSTYCLVREILTLKFYFLYSKLFSYLVGSVLICYQKTNVPNFEYAV